MDEFQQEFTSSFGAFIEISESMLNVLPIPNPFSSSKKPLQSRNGPIKEDAFYAIAPATSKAQSTTAGGIRPSDQHLSIPDVCIKDIGEGLSSPPTALGAGANTLDN